MNVNESVIIINSTLTLLLAGSTWTSSYICTFK